MDWKNKKSAEEKEKLIEERWPDERPNYLWFAVCSPDFPSRLSSADLDGLKKMFFLGSEPNPGDIEFGMYSEIDLPDRICGSLRIRGFHGQTRFSLHMHGQDLPLQRVADHTNTQHIYFDRV